MNSGLLLVLIMHSHARPAILRKINCSNSFEKKKKGKKGNPIDSFLNVEIHFLILCFINQNTDFKIQIPISQSNAPQLSLRKL